MKKVFNNNFRILVIFLSILLITPRVFYGGAPEKSEHPLSLQDAIRIAFKNNKDIQIQEQEIGFAKANILLAKSQFLPQLNLNAGYTHNGYIIPFSAGNKKDVGIFMGYKNDNKLGVSIDQTIYNGGANFANFKQAQTSLEAQNETLRAKKLDVEFEAKRLYYGLLLAYETKRIAEELVNNATEHYEDVKKKFEQGTASKFDVLQSKVEVSLLMPELVKSKNAIDVIIADLKKLLGLKRQDSIDLLDTHLEYSSVEINEEEFLKQAYLNKPEMVLKSLGIDINRWSIEMAKAGWRPQVNAGVNYNYRSNNLGDMFNDKHSNWDAGVSVTIPIFDGFSSKAKVEEARARYAQAVLEKEDLGDQIAVEIRRACLDLQQAQAIIDSQKDNIDEAKEALKIAQVRYDNGEGTNLDILDTMVSLSQVRKNLSEGIYDYLMAHAYLDRTTGKAYIQEAKNESR
jgi:outer membrane protein TolC